ncbi:type VI secretion system contractile sheath large subunit [Polyangium sp. 6x1]|uniref:type VI secretion system contractile sheath domain-containing protein n=1 Tax=Polyangium sp. 6x1 TaxID=3042689 RepID=UPI002482DE98|nr:type VI secretion system contractile sheath large subunit [Polyangium sp. 6x1]MDI1449195.1 type VI secretion system contractile sheath large subunit [Polyangium sp. 6x1]
MAAETKGFMKGGMNFNVGDEAPEQLEQTEGPLLPLRVLVVADLLPRDEHNAGASAPELAVRVDPLAFDDLFTRLRPRVAIEVPSVLAEGNRARVDLAPTSLKSFRPDGLLTEVPLLRSLLDGKLTLEKLRDGSLDRDQARVELDRIWSSSPFVRDVLRLVSEAGSAPRAASFSAPTQAATEASVASILDMVETDPSRAESAPAPVVPSRPQAPAADARFGALISAVANAGKSSSARFSPQEAIQRVEKAIGAQLGAILQHPEVRRLEEAWRGLQLFVDRSKGTKGLKIDVVCARPELAAMALERAARQSAGGEPPVSCAIVDVTITGTSATLAQLEEIARVAEAQTVPVVVNASHALLGLDRLADLERLDNKIALFSTPDQVRWQSTAQKPAMRWVTMAMNGILARAAYDKATSRVREMVVKEEPADEGAMVWIAPAYGVGALITTSFRETRWPCRVVGARSGGTLGNLTIHEVRGQVDDAEVVAIPTQAFVSTDSQRELSKAGVLLLASAPNSDSIYVLAAPTSYVPPPKRTYDSASTEPEARLERVSLVDQLFVARVVQFLRVIAGRLPGNVAPSEAKSLVDRSLWALFEDAKPGSVEIVVNAHATSDGTAVAVTIRPRRFLGVALEEFSLEFLVG